MSEIIIVIGELLLNSKIAWPYLVKVVYNMRKMRKNYGILLFILFLLVPAFAQNVEDPAELVHDLIKLRAELDINQRTALTSALDKITNSEFESSRREVVREDSLAAFEKFAKDDQVMSKALALLLAASAKEALIQAEVSRASWLLEKSKQVFPKE